VGWDEVLKAPLNLDQELEGVAAFDLCGLISSPSQLAKFEQQRKIFEEHLCRPALVREMTTCYPQQHLYEACLKTFTTVHLPGEEATNSSKILVFSDYPSHRILPSNSCSSSPNVFSPSPTFPPRRMYLCPEENVQECSYDKDSERYHPSKKDTVLFSGPSTLAKEQYAGVFHGQYLGDVVREER
jgi:hypothetical protein